jgi:DNA-binding beta-propeller fold protein YncE
MTHPTRARALRSLAAALPLLAAACGDPDAACEPAAGTICTVAGTGSAGFSGDEGPATSADLYLPIDMTVGPDGLLYVIDWNNHRIRVVDADGAIRTVGGSGLLGDGPEGPALELAMNHPTHLAFDRFGRLVIAAWHNSRIKRIDLGTGMLEDVCGTGRRAYTGDDGPAEEADLDLPAGIAFDEAGDLFVMDQANQVVRVIDTEGTIRRFAGMCRIGDCEPGQEPTRCPGTEKWTCDPDPEACTKPCAAAFAGDGGPALEARFAQPVGQAADPAGKIAFDAGGNLYVADTKNHRIRRIDPAGIVTTVAGDGTRGHGGDGGPATAAQLDHPVDVQVAADGTIFIADTMNSCVRAVAPDGTISTFAGICGARGFEGDGGDPGSAKLNRPYGIALAPDGGLYVADTHNQRIRLVLP